jgi:hypothetical protein
MQSFLNGNRNLVNVYNKVRGVYSASTDPNGNLIAHLGDHATAVGFSACSISADGQYVVGFGSQGDGNNDRVEAHHIREEERTGAAPADAERQVASESFRDRHDPLLGTLA